VARMSGATCGACRFRSEPRISRSLSSGGASRRPVGSSGLRLLFRRDRKRWRLRQQCCLEVAPRPAMLAWSMRRVGLIDITVGNAARLGTSLGASQRSTTRRCASHHIATQRASRRGHPGASRAFSADIPLADILKAQSSIPAVRSNSLSQK